MAQDGSTPNFNLTLPLANRENWTDKANNNTRVIDALIGTYVSVLNLKGIWQNSFSYAIGDRVVDSDTGVIWSADVAHNSIRAPSTFADDRTLHPTYWSVVSAAARQRGAWTTNTVYSLNDFVLANGTKYSMCTIAHTSSGSFENDLAAGKWAVLVDVSVSAGSVPITRLLRSFGAVGNGVTDDSIAITAAFAEQALSGVKLDGEGLTYAINGLILMTALNVWIENTAFINLDPTQDMIKHAGPANSITMKRVKFIRNGNGSNGTLSSATLRLEGVNNVLLEELDISGNDAGRGINIETSSRIRIIKPHIHDMNWERNTNPLSELILGIFLVSCSSVVIDKHVIRNLTGSVLGVQQVGPTANYRNTDGISLTGCTDVVISNGYTDTVGEGVDVSGSLANNNVRLEYNTYRNCAAHGEKLVHGAYRCTSVSGRYYNCGISGLTLQGGPTLAPEDVVVIDGQAYDTGSTNLWQASQDVAGFLILGGAGDPILNVTLAWCQAHSTTQEYALRRGGVTTAELRVIGFKSSGSTTSEFDAATNQVTFDANGTVSVKGRLNLDTGSTTVAPLKFSSGPLLTSPIAGVLEFLTDRYYATLTTSTVRKGLAYAEDISFVNSAIATVNFNSANTDTEIPIVLPPGYTRYVILRVIISGASQTLTTATFTLRTASGGGGTAIVTDPTTCTINTASESTNNNTHIPAIVNTATMSYTNASLFFRVVTPQGAAATAKVVVCYEPVS